LEKLSSAHLPTPENPIVDDEWAFELVLIINNNTILMLDFLFEHLGLFSKEKFLEIAAAHFEPFVHVAKWSSQKIAAI
jgi:hypothetical protein